MMRPGVLIVLLLLLPIFGTSWAYDLEESWMRDVGEDGDLRLVGGSHENEGTVLVYYRDRWGTICDDLWNFNSATVVCRQLHRGGAVEYFHGNSFQTTDYPKMWLDQMQCRGSEKRLVDCRRSLWGDHDCQNTEAAGVRCSGQYKTAPKTAAWNPLKFVNHTKHELAVMKNRMFGLRFVQLKTDGSGVLLATVNGVEGFVCAEQLNTADGAAACRDLGMGYNSAVIEIPMTDQGLGAELQNVSRVHTLKFGGCRGNETKVTQCGGSYADRDGVQCFPITRTGKIIRTTSNKAAGIRCTRAIADLVPDAQTVQASAYLTDVPIFYLLCSMEENCVAETAYQIKARHPNWEYVNRRLMRFSAIIANEGTADFLPLDDKETWTWHQCHMHHSMSVFAVYEIYTRGPGGRTVAAGHKASFCLEDNMCQNGAVPRFKCSDVIGDKGTQGISPGCRDIYLHDLDCQWIDVTDLRVGNYKFRFLVNPQFKVAEESFENNGVLCDLYYGPYSVALSNCHLIHPMDSFVEN